MHGNMNRQSNYRGWFVAITIAVLLSIGFVWIERYCASQGEDFWTLARRVSAQLASQTTGHSHSSHGGASWSAQGQGRPGQGIILSIDTSLVGTSSVGPNHLASPQRRGESSGDAVGLMRRPPELVATALLREPLTAEDFVSLPLTSRDSSLNALISSMDQAFSSPIATVSARKVLPGEIASDLASELFSQRFESLRSPTEIVGKMPTPIQLLAELDSLRPGATSSGSEVERLSAGGSSRSYDREEGSSGVLLTDAKASGQSSPAPIIDVALATEIQKWIDEVQGQVLRLVHEVGLEHPASPQLLSDLQQLADRGGKLAEQLQDHAWAASILRTSYSLERRVAVWSAIQGCLDGMSVGLIEPNTNNVVSKAEVAQAVQAVESFLSATQDSAGWAKYLLLENLKQWSATPQQQWRAGNQLARSFLSRVYWARLDGRQRELLQHHSVTTLVEALATWGRDPVDYRQLLGSIEKIEHDNSSRLVSTIADTIQILRNAETHSQKQLAEVLNTHYRNANLRLTISESLVQRFLPEGQYEVRPVRKRILGADTAGDTAVHTQIAVKFHPDPNAWNIELGVKGNMVSATRSSKGPAVFHNMGTAQVNSSRYLKMSPMGYHLSSQPAQVQSTDQLQKMSTDFDGLPVVGDFVRLVVREQFDQKRGLARRITERMIANETDAEIDRRLSDGLSKAERDFTARVLGPLQRLTLDPIVVSMSTSQERLAIRYRLAGETQLSANTPRPRAPTDSLTSFQLHHSVINNTIERIGLSGKDWRLKDLYQSLGSVFEARWSPPEDVPDDITIRFADHRPITIDMVDGKMRLQLRIANLRRDEGIDIDNFVVTSTYVPQSDGLRAGLVRDPEGTIEIQSRHLPVGDRLALRLIFSKVFVSQPEIPLISEEWSSDPRAEGLAVSQLEIRDGWLAVAISDQGGNE